MDAGWWTICYKDDRKSNRIFLSNGKKAILDHSSDLPEVLKSEEEQMGKLEWLSQQETKQVTLNSEDGLNSMPFIFQLDSKR
ncbi:hypothetical protein [Bacillus sp. JCM 19041]|uniref:hypothetical protein n=1 Tax=Bacillus sp. JCM 19041 TaxID=1460637 RepID=UPI0006D2A7AF